MHTAGRPLYPQTPSCRSETVQAFIQKAPWISGLRQVKPMFKGQLYIHKYRYCIHIHAYIGLKCDSGQVISDGKNEQHRISFQMHVTKCKCGFLSVSLTCTAPEVPPSEVSGGGGSRSELVITWDVSAWAAWPPGGTGSGEALAAGDGRAHSAHRWSCIVQVHPCHIL